MKEVLYDISMYYGPVVVVGLLTLYGIKLTLFNNEKLEFNRDYKKRKSKMEEALSIVEGAYFTFEGNFVASKEQMNGAYVMIEPLVNEIIRTEVNVGGLRKSFNDFEGNITSARLNFKVENYQQKQMDNLLKLSEELQNIIKDLDAEYKFYNKRKKVS